jgi:hypothetical protein
MLGEKDRRPAGCGEARSPPLRLCTPGDARESPRVQAPSCQSTALQPHARDQKDLADGRRAAEPDGFRVTYLAGALEAIYLGHATRSCRLSPGCHGNPPHTELNGTRRNGTGIVTIEKACKSALI